MRAGSSSSLSPSLSLTRFPLFFSASFSLSLSLSLSQTHGSLSLPHSSVEGQNTLQVSRVCQCNHSLASEREGRITCLSIICHSSGPPQDGQSTQQDAQFPRSHINSSRRHYLFLSLVLFITLPSLSFFLFCSSFSITWVYFLFTFLPLACLGLTLGFLSVPIL